MKDKSQIADIDRSIYDIRDEKNDAYRMQEGLTPEIIETLSKEKDDMQTEIAGLTEKYQISIQDLMKQQRINLIMRKVRANLLT